MIQFAFRRIVMAIPLLFVVVTLSFFLVRSAPSDPVQVRLGTNATEAAIQAMRHDMGLDQPLWRQYLDYVVGLAQGDFGRSLINQRPIAAELGRSLVYTLQLTLAGMGLALLFGLPIGVWAALERNRPVDYVGRIVSLVGLSLPSFFLGIILMLLFSVHLAWFPVIGAGDLNDPRDLLRHLVLPAVTLGLVQGAYVARVSRSAVLNVLGQDYVRTAKAKGVVASRVIYKHVLRNALIPIIGLLGLYSVVLIGSSLMVEIVFARPGLGKMIIGALESRDYTVLQSVLAVYAASVVVFNLVTDLVVGLVDPRIEYT